MCEQGELPRKGALSRIGVTVKRIFPRERLRVSHGKPSAGILRSTHTTEHLPLLVIRAGRRCRGRRRGRPWGAGREHLLGRRCLQGAPGAEDAQVRARGAGGPCRGYPRGREACPDAGQGEHEREAGRSVWNWGLSRAGTCEERGRKDGKEVFWRRSGPGCWREVLASLS